MEKKTKDLENYVALKNELEKDIFNKLEQIKEKVLTYSSKSPSQDIQILISVSDELEDVLLNWQMESTSTFSISTRDPFLDNDIYVDEDED